MIAVDTNILVYAHREDSPWHDAAYALMTKSEIRCPAERPPPFLTGPLARGHGRIVNNDAAISFKGFLYELPAACIRHRITPID